LTVPSEAGWSSLIISVFLIVPGKQVLCGNLVEDNVLGVCVGCMEGLVCFSRYIVFLEIWLISFF
jgi:hypothetical protein